MSEKDEKDDAGDADAALKEVLKTLAREAEQEVEATAAGTSLFDQAPSAEVWITRAREYDDLVKHLVRKETWLKIAKKIRSECGQSLRVLTLPGRYRLELELYRKEGLIDADPDIDCVGFETSPEVFGLLATAQPPLRHLFNADLVETLVDATNRHHAELLEMFPFDIVNLDLTTNLVTEHDGPYSKALKAIRACLKLQAAQVGSWGLFVTFRDGLKETPKDVINELQKEFQLNLDTHPQVQDACHAAHQVRSASAFLERDKEEALARFFAKWILDQAHNLEWELVSCDHIRYPRTFDEHQYVIRKIAFHFKKGAVSSIRLPAKQPAPQSWHVPNLEEVVKRATNDAERRLEKLREKQAGYVKKLEEELETLCALADAQATP